MNLGQNLKANQSGVPVRIYSNDLAKQSDTINITGELGGATVTVFVSPDSKNWTPLENVTEKGLGMYEIPAYRGWFYTQINGGTPWTSEEVVPVEWRKDTFYSVDSEVLFDNKIYKCKESHLDVAQIDFTKWEFVREFTPQKVDHSGQTNVTVFIM